MDHNILVVDNVENSKVISIRNPTPQQLQALEDCEDYTIIDPLQNLVFVNGAWEPIPTGQMQQDGLIVTVR